MKVLLKLQTEIDASPEDLELMDKDQEPFTEIVIDYGTFSHRPTADIETMAATLYDTYCDAVGGVAFNGDPLPKWAEFSVDPAKQKQANAWRAVAERLM